MTADGKKDVGASQAERFREAARKAEADTSDDALDRVFGKLNLKREPVAECQDQPDQDD